MRRDVRLLIVGDEGVGKSTIITSLLTEAFTENIPHVLPEVTIPKDITPDNVNTVIVDSSSRPEDRVLLETEIRGANVIAVVYAVDQDKSFSRLSNYWLPYIRSLGVNVPVVIVGNKIDLRGSDMSNPHLEETVLPLMNDFKEVETCVECSAKALVNIAEVFYFAQKAVLHPTAPLYDSREHELKAACEAALTRIFRICDSNKDGLLDDEELNAFQRLCFETPLQKAELSGVKGVIRQHCPEGLTTIGLQDSSSNENAAMECVNLVGFLFLHRLFIQRGRLETTWTVLRRFGYEDDLSLREDYLYPISITPDTYVELSPKGYQFLTDLFGKFDRNGDGALDWDELEELFAACPENPWKSCGFPDCTLVNEQGALTLQGFLAQWAMTSLLDPQVTLSHLAYLGFGETIMGSVSEGIKFYSANKKKTASSFGSKAAGTALHPIEQQIRPLSPDFQAQRDVFLCYVLGGVGCGKSSLLRAFLNRPYDATYTPTTRPALAVNAVEVGGKERYLVLKEISPFGGLDIQLLGSPQAVNRADAFCLIYDASDPNSFAYLLQLFAKFPEALSSRPLLIVATKSDCDLLPQRAPMPPDQFCRESGLLSPISVDLRNNRTAELFTQLLCQILRPQSLLNSPSSSRNDQAAKQRKLALWLGLGALGGTLLISTAAYLTLKLLKPKQ